MPRFFFRLAALLILLLLLAPALPARADSAPPPPPEGANLFPGGEITMVRMESETVTIQVNDSPQHPEGLAQVSAEFHMRNLGTQDESMEVRFPLSAFMGGSTPQTLECFSAGYEPISDFRARVDGRDLPITKTDQVVTDFSPKSFGGTIKIPCWANFPVSFPAGKEVLISVSYTTEPYNLDATYGFVEYSYILRSGAGWNGTIGSADIRLSLPYDITPQAYFTDSVYPQGYTVSGNTFHWQLKDFDPKDGPDVQVEITRPSIMRRIQKETAATQANPQDGEAWGRLGWAYKQAIWVKRGFRGDDAAREMFALSAKAYQQAVTLKPKDADWHAGYAELLLNDALWPYMHTPEETRANLIRGLQELKLALDLNPKQAQANAMLNEWIQLGDMRGSKVIDLSQGQPIYLALTQTPELPTTEPTLTATPEPVTPTTPPTATIAATATAAPAVAATASLPGAATPAAVAQAAQATPTAAPTSAPAQPAKGLCGSAALPVGIALLAWWWKNRR